MSSQPLLFDDLPAGQAPGRSRFGAVSLASMPVANHGPARSAAVERLVKKGHRIRAVWEFVEKQDLRDVHARVGAKPDTAVLVALWFCAHVDGVEDPDVLEGRRRESTVYRWLCGDVAPASDDLRDFRAACGDILTPLFKRWTATLLVDGVLKLGPPTATDPVQRRAQVEALRLQRTIIKAAANMRQSLEQMKQRRESRAAKAAARPAAAKGKPVG